MEPNITSLKVQWVKGKHEDQWDLRGDKFVGDAEGDEHKTLLEVDPCPPELIARMDDPVSRKIIEELVSAIFPSAIEKVIGGTVIARLYDGKEH